MSCTIASALVTGGTGFLGTAILDCLRDRHPSCKLSVLDLRLPPDSRRLPNITYYECDITDAAQVSRVFQQAKPTVVIHAAGLIPSVAKRLGSFSHDAFQEVNVRGTTNVLSAAREEGVEVLVFTSSTDVIKGDGWGDLVNADESRPYPTTWSDPYSPSKASAEQLVLSASSPTLKTAAIRTHAVFGPHDTNLIPIFVHALRSPGGPHIRFGDGQNLYDFTHVANAALGHVLAAEKLLGADYARANGLAFNVTNMEPVAFRDMMLAVWREFGHDSDVWTVTVPARGAYAMAWLGERVAWLVGRPPPMTTEEMGGAFAARWFNCSRAVEILGYQPVVGLNDGVKSACNAYKEDLNQQK